MNRTLTLYEPLDPISAVSFDKYYLYRDSLNLTQIIKFSRSLDYSLLTAALQQVVQKYPVLRSRAVTQFGDRHHVVWETIDESLPLPVERDDLLCLRSQIETELALLDNQRHNQSLSIDQTYPFRLYVTQWQDELTQIQLVISHVAADGISMNLFFQDLLTFYQLLEKGDRPTIHSQPYIPSDWETLFQYSLNPKLKTLAQRPIHIDLRRKQSRGEPCYGDKRDWPTLAAVVHQKQIEKDAVMLPFPRTVGAADRTNRQSCSSTRRLHHTFTPDRLRGLRALIQRFHFRASIYDVINAAYVRSQLKMARLARENADAIKLGIAVDLRQFCAETSIQSLIGNMATAIFLKLQLTDALFNDIEQLVQAIHLRKQLELQKMPKAALGRIFTRKALEEPVSQEYWDSFLKTLTSDQPAMGDFLHTSNLGVVDQYFEHLADLKISDIKTGSSPRRVLSIMMIHCFQERISISCTYLPEFTNVEELRKMWSLFIGEIDALATMEK